MIESNLLNLAITSGETHFFQRLGINRDWFTVHAPVYDKFVDHCRKYSEVPSLAWLVSETDTGFSYDECEESADTLVRKLREHRAKTDKQRALQAIASEWATLDADSVTQRIKEAMEDIDSRYGLSEHTYSDWTSDGESRVQAYEMRKSQEQRLIQTGFESWTNEVGPLKPGDYVVLFAPPKTGKTHMSRAFITMPAVRQGFNVLDLALEQPRAEIEAVLDSLDSAYYDVYEFNGKPSGFSERDIIRGTLDDEEAYREFVTQMDRKKLGYGKYVVKTLEDNDMDVCNMDRIETLIELHKPDVVLIDQASLLTFEKTKDNKTGGQAEATSRRFRRICIKYGIVGVMLVQAKVEQEKEEDGIKILSPPDASKIKTTSAFPEDATILVTMDSTKGKALLKCERGRLGGAGFTVDVEFWPNHGICRELTPMDLF